MRRVPQKMRPMQAGAQIVTTVYRLGGGLDQVTPPTYKDPGKAIEALNYEIDVDGGYRRIEGYAAFDGTGTPSAVPGSGSVLGVWIYEGDVYAFRNAADGLSAKMHKATLSGWEEVDTGHKLPFTSGGTTAIVVGNVITGATSSATGTVARVVLTSGTWAGGDAAGYFIITGKTGTFQAENLNVGASTNLATIAGDSTANTLQPGGKYRFINQNFGGSASTMKMYGCDGVNRAFEFDGTAFTFIVTGMASDTPHLVAAHKNHLFLAFGSSVQHSGIGEPLDWSPVLGAGEIALGSTVTGIITQSGDAASSALILSTRGMLFVLYGTSSADWNLTVLQPEAGSIDATCQTVGGKMIALDDRGLSELSRTIAYGNFDSSVIAREVSPYIAERKPYLTCTSTSRTGNQYRLHFSTGASLYVSIMNGNVLGAMPQQFPDPVMCICSQEDSSGEEVVYFGSSNGKVYKMGGPSFDGASINAYIYMAFNNVGGPRLRKRFRRLVLGMRGNSSATFNIGYKLDYGSTDVEHSSMTQFATSGDPSFWDSFVWDTSKWDGTSFDSIRVDLGGTGYNISLMVESDSATDTAYTISDAIIHYTPRRLER